MEHLEPSTPNANSGKRAKPVCSPWVGSPPFTVERVDQLRAEGLVKPRYEEPPLNPDGSMMLGVAYPMYAVDDAGNYLPMREADPALTPKGVAALGLCEGLRVEITNRSYRCAKCGVMQPASGYLAWVPDAFVYGRCSEEQAREMCRQWHSHGSGVCVSCAPKSPERAGRPTSMPKAPRPTLLQRIRDLVAFSP